jgi:ElaB/YqjD/DUF883 family membrane-anchored ribosome-binding protein
MDTAMTRKNGHAKRISPKSKEDSMNMQPDVEEANDVASKAEKGYGKLREKLSDMGNEFETFSSNARAGAETAMDNTVELIRQNPLPALGIALLIGASIGALITAWASED